MSEVQYLQEAAKRRDLGPYALRSLPVAFFVAVFTGNVKMISYWWKDFGKGKEFENESVHGPPANRGQKDWILAY